MHIAFLGNAAPGFFATVRTLRARGVDARLYLLDQEPFGSHPGDETTDFTFQSFTRSSPWGEASRLSACDPADVRRDLATATRIVGAHTSPAFVAKAGLSTHVFVADAVTADASRLRLAVPRRGAARTLLELPYYQRRGIGGARHILKAPWGRLPEATRSSTEVHEDVVLPRFFNADYTEAQRSTTFSRSHWRVEWERVRNESDLLFFHPLPHRFSGDGSRSDVLFSAYARFVRELRRGGDSRRLRLVVTDVGPDTYLAPDRVKELGIANEVSFFPRLGRRELCVGVSHSDLVIGAVGAPVTPSDALFAAALFAKPGIEGMPTGCDTLRKTLGARSLADENAVYRELLAFATDSAPFVSAAKRAHETHALATSRAIDVLERALLLPAIGRTIADATASP
jgi:hypothetical protein